MRGEGRRSGDVGLSADSVVVDSSLGVAVMVQPQILSLEDADSFRNLLAAHVSSVVAALGMDLRSPERVLGDTYNALFALGVLPRDLNLFRDSVLRVVGGVLRRQAGALNDLAGVLEGAKESDDSGSAFSGERATVGVVEELGSKDSGLPEGGAGSLGGNSGLGERKIDSSGGGI